MFIGCLADTQGNPLRSDPDNTGAQLTYRALPHYEDAIKKRKELQKTLEQDLEKKLKEDRSKQEKTKLRQQLQQLNKLNNEPIEINSADEMGFLYLPEYYKKQPSCHISKLDASAILNIMSKASCFHQTIKNQAAKVRDSVRNQWAHAIINQWTDQMMTDAFQEMKTLAKMIPDNAALLKELDEDEQKTNNEEFPMKTFLLKINKYRNFIKDGNHGKIQNKIDKLEKIFVSRKFKETKG